MTHHRATSEQNREALSEQQSILANFGLEALKITEIGDLLQLASELAASELKSGFAKILKYLPEEKKFLIVAGVGWNREIVGTAKIDAGMDSASGFAFFSNEPVLVDDMDAETRFRVPALLREYAVRSVVNVIIKSNDECWGVLEVDSRKPHAFTSDNIHFLQGFSNILGIALSRLESEKRFRMFADFTCDWDYWIDPNGSYVYVSPACEKITGFGPDYFRDTHQLIEMAHPNDRQLVAEHIEEHLQETSHHCELEYRIFNRNGEVRWIAHVCRPVYEEDGRYIGRRASNRDITERKNTEKRLELCVGLMYQSNDGIAVVDLATGRFTLFNEKFCLNLQFSREELLSMCPEDISTKPAGFFNRHFQELRKEEAFLLEDYHRRKDGTTFPVEVNVKYTKVDDREFAIAVFRDITERKKMEEDLTKVMSDLNRSNQELEQFASAVSHDLLEPLRTISGFLNLVRKKYKVQHGREADKFIGYAVDGANRLDRMVRDLFEYSRIQRQNVTLRPVPLFEVWQASVENLSCLIEETGTHITCDSLPVVQGERSQLIRLLQNLMANAITYCKDRSPEIHIGAELQDEKWLISVRDNGIGIKPEYRERIFQMCQRLHTHKEYPGTGIGLAICKKIAERHGGDIWVESEPGKGSTFYFTLPKT